MLTFTLDANCIIAVEKSEPAKRSVERLADAHAAGLADVQVAASLASENQRDGKVLNEFSIFEERLAAIGFAHLPLCLPVLSIGLGFWDKSEWGSPEDGPLERAIHNALHPSMEFCFEDFCEAKGIDPHKGIGPEAATWRNRRSDVMALHSHIRKGRAVFVTSDGRFHKPARKSLLIGLGAGRIEKPEAAAALI